MNSVEQAIRTAISKGDEQDLEFRRKIYGSASAALERSLSARSFTEAEKTQRRSSLYTTIKSIESEFTVAEEPQESEPVAQPVPLPLGLKSAQISAEPFSRDTSPALENVGEPVLNQSTRLRSNQKIKTVTPSPSWWGPKMVINIAFLVAVMIGGFWTYIEATRIYEEASSSKPPSVKPVLAENGVQIQSESTNWIQVFSANDTDLLTSSGTAKAEIRSEDGNRSVAMSGDSGNEVTIKIGAGLLQTFAGKRVLFNFKARNADTKPLETGVRCQFGAATKCDRKRFKVDAETSEFSFAVNVSPNPENEGALFIAPDLTSGGGIIEIESIRATLVELADG